MLGEWELKCLAEIILRIKQMSLTLKNTFRSLTKTYNIIGKI